MVLVGETPFIGFTNNRKDAMIRVSCSSIDHYKPVLEFLEDDFKTFHVDYEMENQFLHQTNISYQDWLVVSNGSFYRSTMSVNIECRTMMKDIQKYSGHAPTKVAPIIKCFVRLKMVSRDGVVDNNPDFHPDPCLSADRIVCRQSILCKRHPRRFNPDQGDYPDDISPGNNDFQL